MEERKWITMGEACRIIGWWDEDASSREQHNDRRRLLRYLQRRERKFDVVLVADRRKPGAGQPRWMTSEAMMRRHCSELFGANLDLLSGLVERVARLERSFRDFEERFEAYEMT